MADSSQPQTQIPQVFTSMEINELGVEDRNCAICQELMEEGSERPIHLPCAHIFGKRCITQWVLDHNSCPQCRRLVLPRPQAQGPPPPGAWRHVPASELAAMEIQDQRSTLIESWCELRAAILYCLRANKFTPITKAIAFVEEQTSTDTTPDSWTIKYCKAIRSTPQMLINGECTARLESDTILARTVEQDLDRVGMEDVAVEQSREFDRLAKVLRERYIED